MFGQKIKFEDFFKSIEYGNLSQVESYISKGLDVNYENRNEFTPLMTAAIFGHDNIVKCLLESGANVNKLRVTDNSSPLLTAIDLSKTGEAQVIKCVQLMISAGAEINIADILGKTPLMAAANMNMSELLLMLLSSGANVNLLDIHKRSALWFAIERGDCYVVKSILVGPADPRMTNDVANMAINFALEIKRRNFAALIQKYITRTLNPEDWPMVAVKEVDDVLASRENVVLKDCKNVAESHLVSWGLPQIIPIFREHEITDDVLRHMTDTDLKSIGIYEHSRSVIIRQMDTLYFKHKIEKTARGTAMPGVTFSEVFKMIENMDEHLSFLYSTFGHRMKDVIMSNHKMLSNQRDHFNISDFYIYCANCARSLEKLIINTTALKNTLSDMNEINEDSKKVPYKSTTIYTRYDVLFALLAATTMVTTLFVCKKNL